MKALLLPVSGEPLLLAVWGLWRRKEKAGRTRAVWACVDLKAFNVLCYIVSILYGMKRK